MMTILLILILGRLGQTAVRAAEHSPNSATRPASAEYVAELSHDPLVYVDLPRRANIGDWADALYFKGSKYNM